MPGLLRGIARTAVVAGTATAVSNRVSRRQANRWAAKEDQAYEQQQQQGYAQQEQYAPPQQYAPAPADTGPDLDKLKELAELHQQGILTDEEFQQQKARLLNS